MNDMIEAMLALAWTPNQGYSEVGTGVQSTEDALSSGYDSASGAQEETVDRVEPYRNIAGDLEEEYGVHKGTRPDGELIIKHRVSCADCKGHGCDECDNSGFILRDFNYTRPTEELDGSRRKQLRYNPDGKNHAWPHNRDYQRSPEDDPRTVEQTEMDEEIAAKPFIG